jgi:hypothetical protein
MHLIWRRPQGCNKAALSKPNLDHHAASPTYYDHAPICSLTHHLAARPDASTHWQAKAMQPYDLEYLTCSPHPDASAYSIHMRIGKQMHTASTPPNLTPRRQRGHQPSPVEQVFPHHQPAHSFPRLASPDISLAPKPTRIRTVHAIHATSAHPLPSRPRALPPGRILPARATHVSILLTLPDRAARTRKDR